MITQEEYIAFRKSIIKQIAIANNEIDQAVNAQNSNIAWLTQRRTILRDALAILDRAVQQIVAEAKKHESETSTQVS